MSLLKRIERAESRGDGDPSSRQPKNEAKGAGTPETQQQPRNPDLSKSAEIKYKNGPTIKVAVEVKQHGNRQDWAGTNLEQISQYPTAKPTIVVADGVSIVSTSPNVQNISAETAKLAVKTTLATITAPEAPNDLKKVIMIAHNIVKKAKHSEPNKTQTPETPAPADSSKKGRCTLVAASFNQENNTVEFAGVGDSYATLIIEKADGSVVVYDPNEQLQKDMKGENGKLKHAIGDNQLPQVNSVVYPIPTDATRVLVVTASDGVRPKLNPQNIGAYLKRWIKENKYKHPPQVARALVRISEESWQKHNAKTGQSYIDDHAIAIMEIDFSKQEQSREQEASFDYTQVHEELLGTKDKLTHLLTTLETKGLTSEQLGEIYYTLTSIPGIAEPKARSQTELFRLALQSPTVPLEHITRQAGLREIVRLTRTPINKARIRLARWFGNHQKDYIPPFIFKQAIANFKKQEKKLRKKLHKARTPEDIITALTQQEPPILIGSSAYYPASAYAELVKAIARDPQKAYIANDFTHFAGLRDSIIRVFSRR